MKHGWTPPPEIWAFLRPEIVAIACCDGNWWGYMDGPAVLAIWQYENGDGDICADTNEPPDLKDDEVYDLDALNLPDILWMDGLFFRPGCEPEGK